MRVVLFILSLITFLTHVDTSVNYRNIYALAHALRSCWIVSLGSLCVRNMLASSLSFIRHPLCRLSSEVVTLRHGFSSHAYTGIPKHIKEKTSARLDLDHGHPIGLAARYIREFFLDAQREFNRPCCKFIHIPFDSDPVTIRDNFDELQVPLTHVSRQPCNNFYISDDYVRGFNGHQTADYAEVVKDIKDGIYDKEAINRIDKQFNHSLYYVLPTHATSHLPGILRKGIKRAIYSGKVFRRDSIDATHFPVFHQLDGFMLFTRRELDTFRNSQSQQDMPVSDDDLIIKHLKQTLEQMLGYLIKKVIYLDRSLSSDGDIAHIEPGHEKLNRALHKFPGISKAFGKKGDQSSEGEITTSDLFRWDTETSFPFTHPSMELYLKLDNQWIEILGCGKLKDVIVTNNIPKEETQSQMDEIVGGWAFGIGLERLVMALCDITDIRQFWDTDVRFLRQYRDVHKLNVLPVFKPYSRNPPVVRDISFYVDEPTDTKTQFEEPQFIGILEKLNRDYIEDVKLLSSYVHPTTGRKSLCYRVTYRAMGKNLTNKFVNELHKTMLDQIAETFSIEIR